MSSTLQQPTILSTTTHNNLIPSLVALHSICITQPTYTIATFLPPLDTSIMTKWWESRVQEVSDCQRSIIMQLVPNSRTGDQEVVGVVMLGMPPSQTGPFRGFVEKLLVAPEWRGKGIAKTLMLKVEEVAKETGRLLLLLDTEKGSPAEVIYPKLGYTKVGEIPAYEISPLDRSLKDGVFFYKDLRSE